MSLLRELLFLVRPSLRPQKMEISDQLRDQIKDHAKQIATSLEKKDRNSYWARRGRFEELPQFEWWTIRYSSKKLRINGAMYAFDAKSHRDAVIQFRKEFNDSDDYVIDHVKYRGKHYKGE